jgi:hypothetical protein
MVSVLFLVIVLLLLLGPLRRRFVRVWRFVLTAFLAGLVGYAVAVPFVSCGSPRWLLTFGFFAAALILGPLGKKWLDDNLGPPRQGGE